MQVLPPKLPSIVSPWKAYLPLVLAGSFSAWSIQQGFAAHSIFAEVISIWGELFVLCCTGILFRGRARFHNELRQMKAAIARREAALALLRGER